MRRAIFILTAASYAFADDTLIAGDEWQSKKDAWKATRGDWKLKRAEMKDWKDTNEKPDFDKEEWQELKANTLQFSEKRLEKMEQRKTAKENGMSKADFKAQSKADKATRKVSKRVERKEAKQDAKAAAIGEEWLDVLAGFKAAKAADSTLTREAYLEEQGHTAQEIQDLMTKTKEFKQTQVPKADRQAAKTERRAEKMKKREAWKDIKAESPKQKLKLWKQGRKDKREELGLGAKIGNKARKAAKQARKAAKQARKAAKHAAENTPAN